MTAPAFVTGVDEYAAEEAAMFGDGPADNPDAEPAPAPARTLRRQPGPPPDPNSKRQRRIAAAAARARTVTAPPKRSTPNKAAAPADPSGVYQRGAQTILGWVMRPLAMGGMALGLAAQMPKTPPAKARQLALHGQALTLDMLTLQLHRDKLVQAAAETAPNVPWMARALQSAAKVGPYASLVEVGASILLQVLANHGVIPVVEGLGVMAPDELAREAGVPMDAEAPAAG